MMNAILRLKDFGQSCWLDNLTRGKIRHGELARRVMHEGVRGVTSNPSIFSKAISQGAEYDQQIRGLVGEGRSLNEVYEALVIRDIQDACDILRPVYDQSDGEDGFVSLEVSPYLAHNAQDTLAEARHLFSAVGRPNCLIKIPGTAACVPVIEQCLYEGVNVNVTLLFSIAAYEAVAHAYVRALERRAGEGKAVSRVASVASFFLSRIDVLVDQLLGHRMSPGSPARGPVRPEQLLGKAAVAGAKLAYQSFRRIFSGERWRALADRGARVQRPLWASTSTKDPLYSDIGYVQPLIGADTVNTMPEETIAAFADHGVCEGHTIEEGLEEARHTLGDLASVGIDLDFVTRQLVDEGIQKFIDPFDQLMKILADRREKVLAEAGAQQPTAWSTAKTDVAALLGSLRSKRFSRRLAARDPHLWTAEPAVADSIRNRLGWLDGVDSFAQKLGEISQFAAEVKAGGCSHAVLAGMGGSSLCPEVCRQTFGRQPGWPELTVLDSTDAAAVRGAWKTLDPSGALFIIASKSGTTTESACFYKYLYEQVRRRMGADEAGRRFVAITDPGSPLAAEAEERDFLRAFLNPADIGGRYSALSYFGLVPMALMGLDISRMMESARRMALSCGPEVPLENNPAVILGAFLAVHRNRGRDKVTLVLSPSIGSLGIWIEQLLAESTGKHGTGLVPIDGESIGKPEAYAGDRIFIGISVKEDDSRNLARRLRDLERAGHPVVRIELSDPYALGGEFLRWEIATATAGSIMGVNPFDEPNVGESKHNTRMLLEEWKRNGSFEDQGPVLVEDGISLYADRLAPWYPRQEFASTQQFLEAFLQSAKAPDYLAWLAYFAPLARRDKKLQKIRAAARDRMRIATTIGYGPRYLHSTGQLHKGGPGNGVFVILTAESKRDLPIPGEDFGFATLLQAQALGDYRALNSKGRRVIRIHFHQTVEKGLARLMEMQSS